MNSAQEIDAHLSELEESIETTTDRIEELADRVVRLKAVGAALADAPSEHRVRRLQARLSALEEHMAHRGPGPCPCARCGWLRLKNGEGPPPEAFHRGSVTFAEDDDQ